MKRRLTRTMTRASSTGESIIAVSRTGYGSVRRTVCTTIPGQEDRMALADLSSSEARRLALTSLGFGGRKPARAGAAHVAATAARLSAIQIDPVNRLAPAHYLPTFSPYGPSPIPPPALPLPP